VIRFAVADLVVVAAGVLGVDIEEVLDVVDLDAAAQALAEPVPAPVDPADRAAALLHGLLRHRPLPRANRAVAVLATAQFLAVNGWRLDLEPAEDVERILHTAGGPAALAAWLRPRMEPARTRPEGTAVFGEMFGGDDRKRRESRLLSERARRVVVLAQEEARLHRHNFVGTEHLLLGLIHEGEGVAARALRSFEVELERVRGRVQEIIGEGRGVPFGQLRLTPRGDRALDLAVREAGEPGRGGVGTEHVLLGVLREGEGIGAQVLGEFGLELDEVRRRVRRIADGAEPA
jgi:prophage maintenance system killer protein